MMEKERVVMDKSFMRAFYREFYSNPQSEAVKDSEEYKNKRFVRYCIEEKLFAKLKENNMELYEYIEKYLDAYADEVEIALEEMYLLGAWDRERMLKTG